MCGAQPECLNVVCLMDEGHQGPHRWWDEESIVKWVPHSESWRGDDAGEWRQSATDYRLEAGA